MAGRISKKRIAHELWEILLVFVFVAPLVVALATYRMYLGVSKFELFAFATALVTAWMVSKVVLIGEILGLGKSSENMPLMVSALHKSVAFGFLYIAFHGLEGTIHGVRHGLTFIAALRTAFITDLGGLLLLGLVAFLASIPFFALREVRRVIGVNAFRELLFHNRLAPVPPESVATAADGGTRPREALASARNP